MLTCEKNIFQRAAELQQAYIEDRENGRVLTKDEKSFLDKVLLAKRTGEYLLKDRGERYRDCRFDNYVCNCSQQEAAVEALTEYGENADVNLKAGKNVIIFGAKGGGKDHLMMSLARRCIGVHGLTVVWRNGLDYLSELRDEDFDRAPAHRRGVRIYPVATEETCDVLWISDPLPPVGALTDYQQALLFRIIDDRYSRLKPVWITANVLNGGELEERIGVQTADRLRHDALAIHCNWPSFRTGK